MHCYPPLRMTLFSPLRLLLQIEAQSGNKLSIGSCPLVYVANNEAQTELLVLCFSRGPSRHADIILHVFLVSHLISLTDA